ncbi:MAG: sodium:proton antiporter [Deltaproteobacteria bacterium]|nr:sodium:proton antiporter [Deltaproteobacteria bacterium]
MPGVSFGAELHAMSMQLGTQLVVAWTLPFICMLLSIALGPIMAPHFWHHNFGKVAIFWGLAFLVPFAMTFGLQLALYEFMHAMLLEYIPFIILLFSLFTVAGGIRLKGSLVGTPVVNAGILLIGTILASWMGTTGAAMLLIRPLLRANAHRKYKVHTVVFFIFTVANIGGSLTPLGDPPLFLGFLQGVDFFWTLTHLFLPMALSVAILLSLYFIIETVLYNKEGKPVPPAAEGDSPTEKLGFEGMINFLLLACIVGAVLMSGMWKPGNPTIIYEINVETQNAARDVLLLFIAALSLKLTNPQSRKLNDFSWGPIIEVAKLFLGIFISIIPVLAILKAGSDGALASVIDTVSTNGVPHNGIFFWVTGTLSSFLDNAPTYLVFFNAAGGMSGLEPNLVAGHLMTEMAPTLVAISAGAVFMGANTYIGNAPNFMVRAIAEDMGVNMPNFFAYMAWSAGILVPLFILLTFIFF